MFRKILTQPIPMPQALSSTRSLLRHWRLIDVLLLWPTGILCGVASGALMNAVNGWISLKSFRTYFVPNLLFLPDNLTRWETVVQHGVWEGFCFGVGFSFVFTIYVALVSRLSCPYKIGALALIRTVGFLWIVSLLSGFNAILLSQFAPQITDRLGGLSVAEAMAYGFTRSETFKENWVWGSINGIYVFGLFAVITGCIWFSADWRKYKSQHKANT
jgi:hypothetical protein